MPNKTFYITTTLPYVNSDPHIGFAMELVRADIIARYKKLLGQEVFFNTGTDEHGQKIYDGAKKAGLDTKTYVDNFAAKFKNLIPLLNIDPEVNFIRTTDKSHIKSAQTFWQRCDAGGFIYKKNYQVKYCVGCELEKTDSDLVDGHCPLHPKIDLELRDEENYFFKFSAFGDKLLDFYDKESGFVVPSWRLKEIRNFVQGGLQDFSISRLKTKMPWGIPVPGDDSQVMYVWFDALVNYISALGWPDNVDSFNKWWPAVQYAGKDNLRQQSAMWQAMLMSVGLTPSRRVVINGFINGPDGSKMSKSLGNVVAPEDLVGEFGAEAVRYYIARHFQNFEDSDFSLIRFKEAYNANLANGLGNLVSRIMKMATTYNVSIADKGKEENFFTVENLELENYNINKFVDDIWVDISKLDEYIQKEEPFKKIKVDKTGAEKDVAYLLASLFKVACKLEPVMPDTAQKIKTLILDNKMPTEALFLRKD